MEEIKVGEYVRTDNGIIGKYVKFRGFEDSIETNNKWIGFDIEKDIVKHSFDIKDLVQAGDLIKIPEGIYEVIYDESYEKLGILIPDKKKLAIRHSAVSYIFNENKDEYKEVEIVTKEQFNQMKYIVGDESNE